MKQEIILQNYAQTLLPKGKARGGFNGIFFSDLILVDFSRGAIIFYDLFSFTGPFKC